MLGDIRKKNSICKKKKRFLENKKNIRKIK